MPRLAPTSILRRPEPAAPHPAPSLLSAPPSRRFALPPQFQFISIYNPGTSVYRARFDEALRTSQVDALAMWRGGIFQEQLGRRWYAGLGLRWHIEADDRRDPAQKAAAARYTKVLQAIPRLGDLRAALQERMWYGKAGANLAWGEVTVDGSKCVTVIDHLPVNGDSIGHHFSGAPQIQVNSVLGSQAGIPPPTVINNDRGRAILLDTPYWRDQFAIARFRPHAPDWGFESDMALAMYGYGLRGRLYWTWWLREEVTGWHLDALKRFGSNGMLYGFFDESNPQAGDDMLAALKQIVNENVAVFPKPKGSEPGDIFKQIDAANIAYEVQAQFVDKMEGVIKRAINGSEETTGGSLGASGYADKAAQNIIKVDADEEGEILTSQILEPCIRMNGGPLPFRLRVVVQTEQEGVGEKLAAIRALYDMRVPIDVEDAYAIAGISPPRDGANVIQAPDPTALPAPGMPGLPVSGEHAADTGRPPASNLPAGLKAEIPREMRAGGDEADADDGVPGEEGGRPEMSSVRSKYLAAMKEVGKRNGKR